MKQNPCRTGAQMLWSVQDGPNRMNKCGITPNTEPVVLDSAAVDQLFREVDSVPGYRLTVDLEEQSVATPAGTSFRFDIEPFRKHSLLHGLDEIGLTLQHADEIRAYETQRRVDQPWLFG